MSVITPESFDRFGARERVHLTSEVLATYARVRWTMRDTDATKAVERLRSACVPLGLAAADARSRQLAAWRLGRIVMRVLRVLPTDSRCLFRSLTLMCLLQRRGIDHEVVIGVRADPFAAHAWVEVDGEPMLPAADPGFERLLEL